jgi:hypothetical protein
MDRSFREQGAGTQQAPKSFLAGLQILASLILWLAGLITLTEEEQEEAGIYHGRLRGE